MSKTEDRLDRDGGRRTARHGATGTAGHRGRPARRLPLAAYVPMGATSRYRRPRPPSTRTAPSRGSSGPTPIVMAHKVQWFSALIFSFLGLIIQVWIPKILQNGITNALITARHSRCTTTWS